MGDAPLRLYLQRYMKPAQPLGTLNREGAGPLSSSRLGAMLTDMALNSSQEDASAYPSFTLSSRPKGAGILGRARQSRPHKSDSRRSARAMAASEALMQTP